MPAKTMRKNPAPPAPRVHLVLMRKMLLHTLGLAAAALGLAILYKRLPEAPLIWLVVLADLVLGLLSGLSARLVFKHQTIWLQFSSSSAAVILGLALLGWATGYQTGIGPLQFGRTSVDWEGLAQILAGIFAGLLVLLVWRENFLLRVSPSPQQTVTRPVRRTTRSRSTKKRTPLRAPSKAKITRPPAGSKRMVKSKSRIRSRSRASVSLSQVEEHRCPYCLEYVKPNDPRGIVECPICHTRHHADCWAITGSCQVPHYNV